METFLLLLLSLNNSVSSTSWLPKAAVLPPRTSIRRSYYTIQLVVATGGLYKEQECNQRKLMTCVY